MMQRADELDSALCEEKLNRTRSPIEADESLGD
jgi:hypothetical protein